MFKILIAPCFLLFALNSFSQNFKRAEIDNTIYQQVDTMPQYIWGEDSLQKYIEATQRDVLDGTGQKITGMVAVNFVVTKAGHVEKIEVYRSQDDRLDAEAINVISSIRGFNPGIKDSKPVNTQVKSVLHFK